MSHSATTTRLRASSTSHARDDLLDTVIALGKKEFQIQRYKGLSVMNPEHSWPNTFKSVWFYIYIILLYYVECIYIFYKTHLQTV